MGSSHPNIVPYGSFPAADGHIIIAVLSESFWGKLCDALERPDLTEDPRFLTPTLRRDHRDECDRLIAEITRTRSVAEWEARTRAVRRAARAGPRGHGGAGASARPRPRDGRQRRARARRHGAAGRPPDQIPRRGAAPVNRAAGLGSAYGGGAAPRPRPGRRGNHGVARPRCHRSHRGLIIGRRNRYRQAPATYGTARCRYYFINHPGSCWVDFNNRDAMAGSTSTPSSAAPGSSNSRRTGRGLGSVQQQARCGGRGRETRRNR